MSNEMSEVCDDIHPVRNESVVQNEPELEEPDEENEQNVPEVNVVPGSSNDDDGVQVLGKRERKRPKYLDDYVTAVDDNTQYSVDYCYKVLDVPQSYKDAMSSPDVCKWQQAMDEEISALKNNDTYDLTPLPEGRNIVGGGGKWVYTVKVGPNGEERHKARYVAKGYS